MGDHFVLLVDRLLTESTLEAALESRNRCMQSASSTEDDTEVDISLMKMDLKNKNSPGKIVECRICHDEDEDSNMETPCSCSGSLKYAHCRCVQRWCNEKGNTFCEICHKQFKPGYTAPPPLFQFGRIPMSLRGNWEISRRDLNSTHLVSMVSTSQNLINSDHDQFPSPTAGSLICCRLVAVFMVFLILRHALPGVISRGKEYTFPLLLLLLFQSAGIVLPVYFMMRAVASIDQHRRQQREPPNALTYLRMKLSNQTCQLHIIRVQ